MSAFHDNALMGASGSQGYQISRSVRLRSSASAYFNRTPGSSGTRTKTTISLWAKRGSLGARTPLVVVRQGATDYFILEFQSDDTLQAISTTSSAVNTQLVTSAVYRDPSAWYHIVFTYDSTVATPNSSSIYLTVNGVKVTALSTATYPSQNTNIYYNVGSVEHDIGKLGNLATYADGYLTEINSIDGQALSSTSFGQFNSVTGVWQPIKYAGTYGTNGFYLNFSDNSNNTAATIGKDYSGNGNNWTPNNISVTSGTTYDSMLDVPTMWADGGNGRGNYAVLNRVNQTTYGSLSDGNLKLTGATDWGGFPSSIPIPKTGKWYAEFILGSTSSNSAQGDCGIFPVANTMYYDWSNSYGLEVNSGFFLVTNGSYSSNRGSTTAGGAVFQIAVDADAGKVWFGVNNAWYDTYNTTNGDPSAGTNPSGSSINFDSTTYQMAVKTDFNNWTANFGQRPFTYTPPTGFKALNTQNLPAPTISNGALYMAATTYTGTGASNTISNGNNNTIGTTFKPDLVWIKSRSAATDHKLTDSVRGTTKALISDTTGAETTDANGLTAFGNTGFTVGSDTTYNNNTATYVGWQWQAGAGTTSSNTSGSITSTVSVNATAGFSVVSFNSGTAGNKTVGHGLGVAPSFIITKNRDGVASWAVWSSSFSNTAQGYLLLNGTGAVTNDSRQWANTAPTSTVFSFESGYTFTASNNIIAYCFSAVRGYSAFGSYTGNGSTDGPFVYLGFRPRFVLFKNTGTAGSSWGMKDTSRSPTNVANGYLFAESSAAEGTASSLDVDFLSNGFKFRGTSSDGNGSGSTYIYAAFAENPFKLALAR